MERPALTFGCLFHSDAMYTTSGSLNLLTPSSTTSRIKDFTSKIQERAASANVHQNKHLLAQASYNQSPAKTPDLKVKETTKTENHLKPPPKVVINETSSHRSRGYHKKRDDLPQKKPSYLNLACSVNGYTNLTTYDSKLRQDINRSREASPIRPITHYNYRTDYNNSLLVPVPVSANKLLVPNFGPHDPTRSDLTTKAPTKAHTDPYLATSPLHVYMAAENKQLKNDFLGPAMTTASRPYISSESRTFASSMLHQKDEVDNAKEVFKSSYSETNFTSRAVNGQNVEARFSSESFTIHNSNGITKRVEITKENGEQLTSPMKSFIQQRVERLYGPGALAQGFFNQKRHKNGQSEEDYEDPKVLTEKSLNCPNDRFNQSYTPKRSSGLFESENYASPNGSDPNLSLPVLRHLRPEFRAQLPILSPKKSSKSEIAISPEKCDIPIEKKTELDKSVEDVKSRVSVINLNDTDVVEENGATIEKNGDEVVRDGHYFLDLEKKETDRLIAMAVSIESELETLQNLNISEEVLGLLRSASGKARLLATQKMQQFQGLCYNNINERGDEQFPTTLGDLQGFWDMVCLQVRNVDALFAHIELLRKNQWVELKPVQNKSPTTSTPSRSTPRARAPAQKNEKARLAAEKRDAERKAMLEHRRKLARERQMAERTSSGACQEMQADTSAEGPQEVEIFVGRNKPQATNGDGQNDVNS